MYRSMFMPPRRKAPKRRPVPNRWWQHPYCWYCGRKVIKSKPKYRNGESRDLVGTVEHIPPLWIARIGDGTFTTVLACARCNRDECHRVHMMFPAYFVQLWTGGTMPRERKMLTR